MNSQLNFWDNIDLETAIQKLDEGDLYQAGKFFEKALYNAIADTDHIRIRIAECWAWEDKFAALEEEIEAGNEDQSFAEILGFYRNYSFAKGDGKMANAVMRRLASSFSENKQANTETFAGISNALIDLRELKNALVFCEKCTASHPENPHVQLMLANLLMLNHRNAEARKIYAEMLVKCPAVVQDSQLLTPEMQRYVKGYGASRAYVFLYVAGVLPPTVIPENIAFEDAEHGEAIKGYQLILELKKARNNGDSVAMGKAGRQLNEHDQELFQAYTKVVGKS